MVGKILAFIIVVIVAGSGCTKQSQEEMVQEGVRLAREGNHNGALVLFKSVLEKDPNYFEARYHLGIAYLRTGKTDKAENEFRKVALQDGGKFPDLPLQLAEVFLRKEDPDAAIREIDQYLQKYPEKSAAFEILGRCYAVKRDYAKAEEQFLRAIRLDSNNVDAEIHLVRALVHMDRWPEARHRLHEIIRKNAENRVAWVLLGQLETAKGNHEEALKAYQKASALDPGDLYSQFMMGRILLGLKRINEGDQVADGILQRAPNSQEGLLLKGLTHLLRNNHKEAVTSFQTALRSRSNLMGHYFLGVSHYHLEQFELAVNQFQRSLDLAPRFVPARIMLTTVLLKQKRFEEAMTEGKKALASGGENGLVHSLIGSASLGLGRYEEAMAEFDRAIELNPDLADAHFKKGLFYLSQGDPEEAEFQLEEAVALAPEVMNSRIILAVHHIRRQNYDEALRILGEGLKGEEQDAVLLNYMSLAAFSKNLPTEAIAYLERAKKAKPDFCAPYFNLASYHIKKGDFVKARQQYEAVLTGKPQSIRALMGMALAYEVEGQDQKALEYFLKAKATGEPAGYLGLAKYYGQKGQIEDLLKVFNEGLAHHPGNQQLLMIKGQVFLDRKDFAAAEAVFDELENLAPGRGYPILLRAYQQQGEHKRAEQAAGKQISKDPKSPYGHVLLAYVKENKGDLKGAEETLRQGLENNPGHALLQMALAAVLEKQNKVEDARRIYGGILDNDPKFFAARYALGALYHRQGDKKAALDRYLEVLKITKNHTPTLNNLAFLYADNYGELEKALELSIQAYRHEPGNPYVLDTLGFVLSAKGRQEEALNLLKKADALLPGNPSIGYHLALAYSRRGKKGEALDRLREILKIGDFPEKENAEKLFQEMGR
ncbi:MAG: PEP-CTERM system TPR-repeat protein PrsT [Deltaproteobacteria bacterium]|nr:PEP-CTERM system TPR-repeat protein PrsT [Deltaproteobacteria bacterium]